MQHHYLCLNLIIMKRVIFYLTVPFIYLIAILPFSILYLFSDFLYLIFRFIGYRKKVILTNLTNSFPDKTPKELYDLYIEYISFLCDILLETFKILVISKKELNDKIEFEYEDWLQEYLDNKRSAIVIMGHIGNWALIAPYISARFPINLHVIYRKISNPHFERFFLKMRTRFNTKVVNTNNTLRHFIEHKNKIASTVIVADQANLADKPYWAFFLNQDTTIYAGPEKLAKKFNLPVIYVSVIRTKRGHYKILTELITDTPNVTEENEIMFSYISKLERDIKISPATWLWSHKRWKRNKNNEPINY